MAEIHAGACLCGAVRFTTSGPLRDVVYCHCRQCRRQSGHFVAATNVEDGAIVIDGAENLKWFAASDFARRGFCGTCGSLMFWKRKGGGDISVMAGAFDAPSGLTATMHIFTADRGDYYRIADGLPQHPCSSPAVKTID